MQIKDTGNILCLFLCIGVLDMERYELNGIQKKDARITIRVSETFMSYLNKCSDFFGISKSHFLKERCLSDLFIIIRGKDIPEDFMNTFIYIADVVNDVAHELNALYKKTLDTNRLDLIFHDDFFIEQTNKVKSCINLWENGANNFNNVFSYSSQNKVIPFYESYFDEYNSNVEVKNKFVCIRVSQSFYKMICDISKSLSISVTQYIINCCINPMYTELCCVYENEKFLNLACNIENNIRQIKLAIMKINERNKECSGRFTLNEMNEYFDRLDSVSNDLFVLWKDFRSFIGEKDKELYFECIKKRHLLECVKATLKETDPDFLKIVGNRENHI